MSEEQSIFKMKAIEAISKGTIHNFYTFFTELGESVEYTWELSDTEYQMKLERYSIQQGEKYLLLPEDKETLVQKYENFKAVLEFLRFENLITFELTDDNSPFHLMRRKEGSHFVPASRFMEWIGKDYKRKIVCSPRLNKYIARRFQNQSDYQFFLQVERDEREDRRDNRAERQENASRKIGRTTLFVAFASLVISAISAYQSSDKRTVTIKNAKGYRDTVYVNVMNPIVRYDTVYRRDTVKIASRDNAKSKKAP